MTFYLFSLGGVELGAVDPFDEEHIVGRKASNCDIGDDAALLRLLLKSALKKLAAATSNVSLCSFRKS